MDIKNELWIEYIVNDSEQGLVNVFDSVSFHKFLKPSGRGTFIWNGDLDISDCGLEKMPDLRLVEVAGDFNITRNYMTSFENGPCRVGGNYIANGTKIKESPTLMDDFPKGGVGGDLEIMFTNIDVLCGSSKEERAADLVIVDALQARVGGRVWTSAVLREEQEMLSMKAAEASVAGDMQKVRNIREKIGVLNIKFFQALNLSEAAKKRDEEVVKKGKACRHKAGKKLIKEVNPERDLEKNRIFQSILSWAKTTQEKVQLAVKKNEATLCKNTKSQEIQTQKRKQLWMRLYVLGEVMRVCAGEKESIALVGPAKKVWNKARNAFSRKDEQYGDGLSFSCLDMSSKELWTPTKIEFGLDNDGLKMQKNIKSKGHDRA